MLSPEAETRPDRWTLANVSAWSCPTSSRPWETDTCSTKPKRIFRSRPMFPLILLSLCAHKISLVQHYRPTLYLHAWTHLNLEWRVRNMRQSIFGGNIYVRFKVSSLHSSQGLKEHWPRPMSGYSSRQLPRVKHRRQYYTMGAQVFYAAPI